MASESKVVTILQVSVSVAPENAAKFLEYFKESYDKVLAEPECAYFLFGEEQGKPGVFSWTEGWTKDVKWLMEVQLKKEYYVPYIASTVPLWISERVVKISSPMAGLNNVKAEYMLA